MNEEKYEVLLPPLPSGAETWFGPGFTADQMRAYGQACAAMARGAAVRDYIENGAEAARQPAPVVEQLVSALNAMLTYMGMDEDEWNKPTFDQARAAIAAAEQKGPK